MTTQTVTFARSINEKIIVAATSRDGWVKSLFVGSDGAYQYYVKTTEASGEPSELWCREADMSDATPPVEPPIEPPVTPPAT